MGLKRTDEFRQDAVRIALISGLTRKQVAYDLSVGMSTLNKWITACRDTDMSLKRMIGFGVRFAFSRRSGTKPRQVQSRIDPRRCLRVQLSNSNILVNSVTYAGPYYIKIYIDDLP